MIKILQICSIAIGALSIILVITSLTSSYWIQGCIELPAALEKNNYCIGLGLFGYVGNLPVIGSVSADIPVANQEWFIGFVIAFSVLGGLAILFGIVSLASSFRKDLIENKGTQRVLSAIGTTCIMFGAFLLLIESLAFTIEQKETASKPLVFELYFQKVAENTALNVLGGSSKGNINVPSVPQGTVVIPSKSGIQNGTGFGISDQNSFNPTPPSSVRSNTNENTFSQPSFLGNEGNDPAFLGFNPLGGDTLSSLPSLNNFNPSNLNADQLSFLQSRLSQINGQVPPSNSPIYPPPDSSPGSFKANSFPSDFINFVPSLQPSPDSFNPEQLFPLQSQLPQINGQGGMLTHGILNNLGQLGIPDGSVPKFSPDFVGLKPSFGYSFYISWVALALSLLAAIFAIAAYILMRSHGGRDHDLLIMS